MEEKSNPNWERISQIIDYSRSTSVSAFARHIGLNRGENLYQIKRGNNGISKELAERICEKFPEISKAWILTGENQMLVGEQFPPDVAGQIVEIPFYIRIPDDFTSGKPDKILYGSREMLNDAEIATVYRGGALLPTYKSGAILFLKRWDMGIPPLYGNVYLIRTKLFERFRIVRQAVDSEHFRLTTFQSDRYDDMTVPAKSIKAMYFVCGANII